MPETHPLDADRILARFLVSRGLLRPRNAMACLNRAIARQAGGDRAGAIRDFEKALDRKSVV